MTLGLLLLIIIGIIIIVYGNLLLLNIDVLNHNLFQRIIVTFSVIIEFLFIVAILYEIFEYLFTIKLW